MQIKILALCGSSRRDSLNQKLLDIASMTATGKPNMDFLNARVR
jgi:NAD(P)H-dependent FMN reductase